MCSVVIIVNFKVNCVGRKGNCKCWPKRESLHKIPINLQGSDYPLSPFLNLYFFFNLVSELNIQKKQPEFEQTVSL